MHPLLPSALRQRSQLLPQDEDVRLRRTPPSQGQLSGEYRPDSRLPQPRRPRPQLLSQKCPPRTRTITATAVTVILLTRLSRISGFTLFFSIRCSASRTRYVQSTYLTSAEHRATKYAHSRNIYLRSQLPKHIVPSHVHTEDIYCIRVGGASAIPPSTSILCDSSRRKLDSGQTNLLGDPSNGTHPDFLGLASLCRG